MKREVGARVLEGGACGEELWVWQREFSGEWGKRGLRQLGAGSRQRPLAGITSSAEPGVLLNQVPSRSQSSVGPGCHLRVFCVCTQGGVITGPLGATLATGH